MSGIHLVVRVSEQVLELWDDQRLLKRCKVSTAINGLGCEQGSNQTPLGTLRVAQKIGAGHEFGAVFRGRKPTGEVWSSDPVNPLCETEEDLVLTRILWLEGCESHNANTLERFIYLHGTNQEHLLGRPASHGCIRLSNEDIVEIFEIVPEGAIVEVIA